MIPNNAFSAAAIPAAFIDPDFRDINAVVDYELGGVALSDPSQGHFVQVWKVWFDTDTIYCSTEDGNQVTALITGLSDVTEVSFAFDQNMNAIVAYVYAGDVYLYWYDTAIAAYTITRYPFFSSPKLCHDDKRESQRSVSDVLFFYIREGALYYRQQRDRYDTERWLADLPDWAERISAVGMSVGLRLQILFRPDTYAVAPTSTEVCVVPTVSPACLTVVPSDYHGP